MDFKTALEVYFERFHMDLRCNEVLVYEKPEAKDCIEIKEDTPPTQELTSSNEELAWLSTLSQADLDNIFEEPELGRPKEEIKPSLYQAVINDRPQGYLASLKKVKRKPASKRLLITEKYAYQHYYREKLQNCFYSGFIARVTCINCLEIISIFPCKEKRVYYSQKDRCPYCRKLCEIPSTLQVHVIDKMVVNNSIFKEFNIVE